MSRKLASLRKDVERLKRVVDFDCEDGSDNFDELSACVPPVEGVNEVHWLATNGSDCFETFAFLMRTDPEYKNAPKQALQALYDRYHNLPLPPSFDSRVESNDDENDHDRFPEGFQLGEFN